ncbi:response regulator transcription factor [Aquimarina agarivorans]|uniref:response regulator transcription factor n=1 Tax=Aquimarina agarivorans TaxID=980584 RepID=UPI000248E9CB|nr:response regulator transcription factor [Aquimarina agarivorans]
MHINKILLVDDHSLVRDGIKSLLENESDLEVVGEASNGEEAIQATDTFKPDLVICDIRMPKKTGIEAVSYLTKQHPTIKFIMLSMHDSEEYILQSIQAGAHGYLLKDAGKDEVLKAIHSVLDGGKYFSGDVSSILVNNLVSGGLNVKTIKPTEPEANTSDGVANFNLTKREKQILEKAVAGLSNKEIAEELGISKRTTEVHRFNLMKKLNVKNILDLSNKARKYGLLDEK